MDFFDVVTTQRAMRRLKSDAIADDVLRRIMDAAICAPSGGNRQNWSFVVVRDPAKRARLGELYREAWGELMKVPYYAGAAKEPADSQAGKMLASARHLAEHLGEAPVIILACVSLDPGIQASLTTGASIYPAVQNIMLAARALGGRRDSRPDPAGLSARKIWASAAPAGARGGLRGSLGPGALIPIIDMWPVSSAQVLTRFASRRRATPRSSRTSFGARSRHSRGRPTRRRVP